MFQKILVGIMAFIGSFIIVWYGNFTGKLPTKGTYLGFSYDSVIIRAVVTQFEYLWVLIIANILFTLIFQIGFEAFKNNFLTLAIVWLSTGPLAALIFNTLVLKEKVSAVGVIGVFLLISGSVLVIAQKEILQFFQK